MNSGTTLYEEALALRADVRGIRDDIRKAVARLEHDEPEKYGRLAAIIAGGSG